MAKRKARARTVRREQERKAEKLERDLDRLAALERGGSPERPIELESASQVEVHARATPCHRCRGTVRVEEHTAGSFGSGRLRVALVACPACGARRALYFRLAPELAN